MFAQTTVDIIADRDNTMYEEFPSNSNGAGQFMFSGNTNAGNIRRALVHFDVAGNIPAGATITNAILTLHLSKAPPGNPTSSFSLHRLTKDWGEGTSNAGSPGGTGTSAEPNDATWIHNFYNTSMWTNNGANGDYNTTASAMQTTSSTGFYSWSSAQLDSDAQDMLDNPGANFGWIIIGDESTLQTAKRFDTHENSTPANRPELSITYTMPTAQNLIINEVDYDQPGTDDAEFIELKNADNTDIDLSNYEVELVNGSSGVIYQTIALPNVTLAPGDYFVICANDANTPNCDMEVTPATNLIQNGSPDAIGIRFNSSTLVDAVSYEGNTVAPYTETDGTGLEDDGSQDNMGISRFPDGVDTDVNNVDFTFLCITPGLPNGGPEITLSPAGTAGFCPGDSITLTVSGDNQNPQWYRNGSPVAGANDTFYVASTEGVYNAITEKGFCTDSAATGIIVQQFTPPQVDLGPDTSVCQSYLLDAGNPGSQYDWSSGQQTRIIQVTSSGTYAVTVTGSNGCTGIDTVTVTIGSPFSVNLADTTAGCDSAVIDAGVMNNATYSWNTGDTGSSIVVATECKYWVDVARTGCTATDTTYVVINQSPEVNLGPDVSECDSIILSPAVTNATDPVYRWNTGDSTSSITITESGTFGAYMVTVTSNGCSASDTVMATILADPQVDLGEDFQACNEAILNAGNAGNSYQWSTGETSQTIQVTSTGEYSVTVTDTNGCTNADTVQVTISPSLMVDLGGDATVCDSTELSVNIPNATYIWSNGATTQSTTVTSSGAYSVTVTQDVCMGSDTANITVNASPAVDLGTDITACDEATLDAGVQSGAITWYDGSSGQTNTVTASGTYFVEVEENGCIATDTVEVTINATPDIDLGPDVEVCDSAVLDAGVAEGSYQWSTGETTQTITVTTTGTYIAEVTKDGCTASDTIVVTVNPAPSFSLGASIEACESATLEAPVSGSYAWSTGETSSEITVTQNGSYALTITNAEGCTAADTVNVTIHENPVVDLGEDVVACDSAELMAMGGIAFAWSTGATTSTITVTQAGNYSVTVTDQNGCTSADTVNVEINTAPEAAFTYDNSECPLVLFSDNSTGAIDSWEWDFGDTSAVVTTQDAENNYSEDGDYTVVLTVSNQCGTDTASQTVSIDCIVGIEDFDVYFQLYPNPAGNVISIRTNDTRMTGAAIELRNVNGKILKSVRLDGATQHIAAVSYTNLKLPTIS
jgi:hypothetical protein